MREEMRIKYGAKHAKFRQMVAKQNQLLIWRQAIEEAQIVSCMSHELRLDKFFEIHKENVYVIQIQNKVAKHIRLRIITIFYVPFKKYCVCTFFIAHYYLKLRLKLVKITIEKNVKC